MAMALNYRTLNDKKIINSYQYFVIYDFVSYELQKKLKNYNMMIYYKYSYYFIL